MDILKSDATQLCYIKVINIMDKQKEAFEKLNWIF